MRSQLWGLAMVEAFSLWLEAEGKGEATLIKYKPIVRRYLNWCASHEIDHLTADKYAVTAHLGDLAKNRRPATVDAAHTALRVFYDFLIDEGFTHLANPARSVKRRKRACRPTEPFTVDELRRLYDACQSHKELAIFLILLNTGLRRGEIIGIKRGDLDWDTGLLSVFGKGSKWRQVRLTAMTLEALQLALAFDERLWTRDTTTFARMIKDLGKRARISGRMHPHRFRKTMATDFLDAGGTIEELQAILGHATVGMSLVYAESGKTRRALARMREIDLAARLLTPEPVL